MSVDVQALQVALQAAGVGVWDWNLLTGRINYSPRAREICGFRHDADITPAMVRAVIHPDDRAAAGAAAARALDPECRTSENYLYRVVRQDDHEVRWVRAHGQAEFAELDGKVQAVRYTGSLQDVHEREATRFALQESEARLHLALDAAGMAVWDLDLEADVVTSSPELNRLFGFPLEARPTAEEFRNLYAPGELDRLRKEGEDALARGETMLQSRVRYIIPGRGERIFILRASFFWDGDRPRRAIGVVFDVTEQARQDERLATLAHELRHRLKNLVQIVGVIARRTWNVDERMDEFMSRMHAIGLSADLMFGRDGEGIDIGEVTNTCLAPFRGRGYDPFLLAGPAQMLDERTATGVALALHELATNAVKHGALSVPRGQVAVEWRRDGADCFVLVWQERCGPAVEVPSREGFGLTLVRRAALDPRHDVTLAFQPEGVRAEFRLKL